MANYKVVDADALDADLTELSDSIRAKTGGTAKLSFPDGMKTAVAGIDTSTTPEITVSSGGLITATSGSKSNTKQLTTQAAKTVTPTTSEQTAVASEVFTTGEVKVAAMPTATQATPSISVDSAGKITASATQSAGYVSAGTKSATKQLTTQAAKTVTPSTSEQTAVNSGVYTTGAVKVAAMPTATQATPSISVDSAGKITASATQTAGYVAAGTKTGTKQMTTQAAKEITPSTTDQTAVAKNVYTTGAVTVKGDANLKAENIAEGVSIFGVTGTFAGGGGEEWITLKSGTQHTFDDSVRGCLVLIPSTSATTFETFFMYYAKASSLAYGNSPSYANHSSMTIGTDHTNGYVTDITYTTKNSYKTAYALLIKDTPL